MFSSYANPNDYVSYKKLVKTLGSNFGYDLPMALVGKRTIEDVVSFKSEIEEQQALIAESSYEYSNEKYRKNVIVLEALGHLINLLEIRTYRLEPKSGALVNYKTQEEKQKTLKNPKDNRPDLYFTQDHLNIEEPINVVGPDANDVVNSVTNAANQVAPEDNLKKAEVYVGVHDGDPNYTTPTNDALEKELAGLTSGDLLNITDKVKKEVKKEIAAEISDAILLQKRKNEEQKLGEGNMSHKILSKLLESEMEKAEIVLGVKAITDDLQQMAEKISRMQIEDMSALTERLKAEFGIERGDQFQAEVGGLLGSALAALQQSKSSIDNSALALTGDSAMAASGAAPAPAPEANPLAAPDETADELPGKEPDMFVGHEAAAGPEEEPLGRAKKESIESKRKKLSEMKKFLEEKGMIESKMYKQIISLTEKWDTEMHTAEKDKGMFKGKPQAKIKKELTNLKDRQEAHKDRAGKADPAISKKIKQHEFALRAKHHFESVNEDEMCAESGSKQLLMDEAATRKHFRDVANTLKHVPDMEKRKELAKSHADAFKKMNPRFNHSKFFNACDIHEEAPVANHEDMTMHESAMSIERGMGNKKAANVVNPKTPKNTAKILDKDAANVKKK